MVRAGRHASRWAAYVALAIAAPVGAILLWLLLAPRAPRVPTDQAQAAAQGLLLSFAVGRAMAMQTVLLWLVVIAACAAAFYAMQASQAARRQLELADKDFVSIRRPRIHVRFVETEEAWDPKKETVTARITYVNLGESEAYIHRFVCDAGLKDGAARWIKEPLITDISGKGATVTTARNGESQTTIFTTDVDVDKWRFIRSGAHTLYIAGYCRYDDRYGVERKTGFIWEYSPSRNEFFPKSPGVEPRFSYED
jgi:hypothetical protein